MTLAPLMAGVALIGLMAQPALAQNQDQAKPQQQMSTDGAQQQLTKEDADFVKKAAGDGLAEVELGKLAQQQAESDQVKQFGQRMVDDHGKANEELKTIADQKGIDLPPSPPDEAQQVVDDLKQKSGAEFDQAYMEAMVEDHQKAVELFEQQTKAGKDAELQGFAEATLPTLQEHLELAEQAKEQVSAAAGQGEPATTGQQQTATQPMPGQATDQEPKAAAESMPGQQQAATEPAEPTGAEPAATEPSDEQKAATEPAEGEPTNQQQQAATKPAGSEPAATEPAEGEPTNQQQQAAPAPAPAASEPAEQQQAATEPAGEPVLAEDVIGTQVVNDQGDEVGEIKDLVIDQNQIEYVVISVGGFLGIGAKDVAVPLEELKLGEDQSYLISAKTEEQLEQMPEYQEGQYQPKG